MSETNLKFSVFDRENVKVPVFAEKKTSGKPYLLYGGDNRLPDYLWDLYLRSALMQGIVNGTADYVLGNGIEPLDLVGFAEEVNRDGDTLEDVIKKIVVDDLIFGGFAIEIIRNRIGEVSELHWLDFRKVRVNEAGTEVYYSEDWTKQNNYIVLPIFDGSNSQLSSVLYFKGHITRGAYPIPRYNGALAAIETSTRISNYHLNAIKNNFSANFVVNFNNGTPTEDVKREIERELKNKFTGDDNAGRFIVSFNESKDNAVTFERLQDDNTDKKYEQLRTDTLKEIFISFRAQPQLFGFSLEGTAFNQQEFEEAFKLYNKTVVSPIQRDIKRCFNKIFQVDNAFEINPFIL